MYVRQRNEQWEMKARQTGDLVSTGCIEVQGQARVEASLKDTGLGVSLVDLGQVAKMETVRKAWKIGDFVVSVDDIVLLLEGLGGLRGCTLHVPHSVGEVELCKEAAEGSEVEMHDMTERIDGFMETYGDVFRGKYEELCPHAPEGQVAAFFRWEEMVRKQRFLPALRWKDERGGFVLVLRQVCY